MDYLLDRAERLGLAATAASLAALALLTSLPAVPSASLASVTVPTTSIVTTLPQESPAQPRKCPPRMADEWAKGNVRSVPLDDKCLPLAKRVAILFEGDMEMTSGAAMRSHIEAARKRGQAIEYVRLVSPGGSSSAGIAMGEALYQLKTVPVLIGGWCASACSTAALLAGKGRIVMTPGATIGVHAARDAIANEPDPAYTRWLGQIWRARGVPADIVRAMVSTPPSDITELTQEQLRTVGATWENPLASLQPVLPA